MGKHDDQPTQRQLWLLPSAGETREQAAAEIAVRVRTMRTFDYAIPAALASLVVAGAAVTVPYGRSGRLVPGWCLKTATVAWKSTRKPIRAVADDSPLLTPPLIELARWVSRYYACPPALVIEAMVPAAARKEKKRRVSYVSANVTADQQSLRERDQQILQSLGTTPCRRREFLATAGVSRATLRRLMERGLVIEEIREERAGPVPLSAAARGSDGLAATAMATASAFETSATAAPEDSFALTASQQAALDAVSASLSPTPRFAVWLAFGIPGSGKTEVYVRAMRQAIAAGRQAIMLVPEIALATQLVARIQRRFERVAVIHSRLTPTARARTLRQIAAGQSDVVIGTRSAVFAPCPRPGLLVVDEEQETSFKSLALPYYHARDVAIKRAQLEQIPILLGSATPSLESWYNATHGRYTLLRLPERAPGATLPRTELIDTRRETDGSGATLSGRLCEALRETLAAGRQAILLLNRRGYAARLRCRACRLTVSCPRCGVHMIEHRGEQRVRCHRCGVGMATPAHCVDESCRGPLERTGMAIQRLEEELLRAVPAARLLRLDRDTMKRREQYAEALRTFESGAADILLGTQMVAKGLDFPRVGLVGVLEADAMLALPDFRASEQAFQLITQVVGRAGRREGESCALIQSAQPEHQTLLHALRLDYEGFAASELTIRRDLRYPPFGRLIRIVCSDERPKAARMAAEALAADLNKLAESVSAAIRVHAAQPCIAARLRERTRYEVLVQTPRDGSAQQLLERGDAERTFRKAVQRLTIDVDPYDMM